MGYANDHLKTLHLQLKYGDNNKIISAQAFYYSSKNSDNDPTNPSLNAKAVTQEALKISSNQLNWIPVNFGHQDSENYSDCGYYTYHYCYELFLTGRINPQSLSEESMKLLYIQAKLLSLKAAIDSDKANSLGNEFENFYNSANQCFLKLTMLQNVEEKTKIIINELYKGMLQPEYLQKINDFKTLQESFNTEPIGETNATRADVELLYIKNELEKLKSKTESEQGSEFYLIANAFYEKIIRSSKNPARVATIHVLYQFLQLPEDKRIPETCIEIKACQALYEGKIKNLPFNCPTLIQRPSNQQLL